MTLRFTLTRDEYVRAARSATLRRPLMVGSFAIGLAALAAGVAVGWTAAAVWGVLYVAVLAAAITVAPRRTWARSEEIRNELVIELSDEEVTVTSLTARSTTQWTHWIAASLSGTTYRISSAGVGGLLVPRRVFASPAEEAEFLGLLRRHVDADIGEP